MFNLSVNFPLKPEMPSDVAAKYLAEFIQAAKKEGITFDSIKSPTEARSNALPASESYGPYARLLLSKTGGKRVKRSIGFTGTVEDYAKEQLTKLGVPLDNIDNDIPAMEDIPIIDDNDEGDFDGFNAIR
jgi:hypothetical protein